MEGIAKNAGLDGSSPALVFAQYQIVFYDLYYMYATLLHTTLG